MEEKTEKKGKKENQEQKAKKISTNPRRRDLDTGVPLWYTNCTYILCRTYLLGLGVVVKLLYYLPWRYSAAFHELQAYQI